ncbi:hypothetical protein [Streptomyces sp. NPDC059783]|uniref:hypothetical protein n=1 Tax=Streptomyces sp. NPDC059783 TaxID=3346944 RepID=UPI00365DADFE
MLFPPHIGEVLQETVAGRSRDTYVGTDEGDVDAGREISGPEAQDPGDLAGLAGQGVNVAEVKTAGMTALNSTGQAGDQAGQQPAVAVEKPSRSHTRIAEGGHHMGFWLPRTTAPDEPAMTLVHQCGGLLALRIRTQGPDLVDG